MRLIDADALMEIVTRNSYMLRAEHNSADYGMFLSGIKQAVDEAPAADVQPVVHGWWVEIGRNSHDYETSIEEKCSLCGRYVYRYDTQPQDNYCPNCGARMGVEPPKED